MLARVVLARSTSRALVSSATRLPTIAPRARLVLGSGITSSRISLPSLSVLQRAYSASAAKKVDELFSDDDFFSPELTTPSPPVSSAPTPTLTTAASSSSTTDAADPADIDTFAGIKGRINYDTWKALTFKPFQFVTMSEVQKRVLSLMPELSGGKTRPKTLESEDEAQAAKRAEREKGGRQDLLVKAKTGTGKTIAFLVPALEARLNKLDKLIREPGPDGDLLSPHIRGQRLREISRSQVGCLIISPTRELASQIAAEASKLCTWNKELQVQLLVGGTSRVAQMRQWHRGRLDVVVATPGRLKDLMSEPEVLEAVQKTDMLVLDEADTLLDMGFAKELDFVINELPKERQTFLFSATVSPEIARIAKRSLSKNHAVIDCVPENESNVHLHIPQFATVLPSAAEQIPHVLRLIAHDQLVNGKQSKVIVFLPTTKQTMLFASLLRELSKTLPKSLNVHEIHSRLDQSKRSRTSDRFRKDAYPSVLVTSDVSARGVDYPGVTRVIQVGIPSSPEQYIHRVGRTGRGGKTGGRGDLVLLPFEAAFLDSLEQVPIKSLPFEALTEGSDAESEVQGEVESSGGAEVLLSARVAEEINEGVAQLMPTLDADAIEEVFMSLLGYYIGKSSDINVSSREVLAALKDWTTQAGGLETAPYVSAGMLAKLGVKKERNGGGGGGVKGYGGGKGLGGGFGGNRKPSFGFGKSGGGGGGGYARAGAREGREGRDGGWGERGSGERSGRSAYGKASDAYGAVDRPARSFDRAPREREFTRAPREAREDNDGGYRSRARRDGEEGNGGNGVNWDDEARRPRKVAAPWMGRGKQSRKD